MTAKGGEHLTPSEQVHSLFVSCWSSAYVNWWPHMVSREYGMCSLMTPARDHEEPASDHQCRLPVIWTNTNVTLQWDPRRKKISSRTKRFFLNSLLRNFWLFSLKSFYRPVFFRKNFTKEFWKNLPWPNCAISALCFLGCNPLILIFHEQGDYDCNVL